MITIRPNQDGKFKTHSAESLMTGFHEFLCLGNFTMYKVLVVLPSKYSRNVIIGIEGKGCYSFSSWVHWEYAGEKLGLRFGSDARNIADFINDMLGLDCERQGSYDKNMREALEEHKAWQ